MRKKLLLVIGLLTFIVLSCNVGMSSFRKEWYYSAMKRSSAATEAIVVDVEIEEESEEIDSTNDPFEKGAWNDINYLWDGSQIKDWTFHVSFDDKTVPTYKFEANCDRGHGPWVLANDKTKEHTSKSPDGENKAQNYEITEMTIYRYDGKNPLIGPDKAYNLRKDETDATGKSGTGRMERFLFYRIKGKSVIVGLDQHLIAVDTYSKLVFAYGAIISTTTAAGNHVPNGFATIDGFESSRGEVTGVKLPFYLYDPLGFVKEDGTVVLYNEYKTEMGASPSGRMPGNNTPGEAGGQVNYFPQIHNSTRDYAGYIDSDSAGRSPYLSNDEGGIEVIETDEFCEAMGNQDNQPYRFRRQITYRYKNKDGQEVNFPRLINGPDLDSWMFDDTGRLLTHTVFTTGLNNIVTSTTKMYIFVDGQDTSNQYERKYKSKETGEEITIVASADWKSFYVKGNEGTTYSSGYTDRGIEFILRVRGAEFVSTDASYGYKFSEDGGTCDIYGIGRARIGKQDRAGRYFYDADPQKDGEDIYTYTTYKDNGDPRTWGQLRLSNYDFTLDCDIEVGGFGWKAYRTAPGVNESDLELRRLFTQLANRVFLQREKMDWPEVGMIYGWKLMSYSFSGNGRTLTITEKDGSGYVEKITTTELTCNDTTYSGGVLTYTGAGNTYKIKIDGNKIMKYDNSLLGEFGYTDPGPHWLLRVAGATFSDESGETKYEFSDDGLMLDLTYRGLQYVVVKAPVQVKRKWNGSVNDTTESSYADWNEDTQSTGRSVAIRLQDVSGGSYADKSAAPGTNRFIKVKQTAYGWQGTTWEYEAKRR